MKKLMATLLVGVFIVSASYNFADRQETIEKPGFEFDDNLQPVDVIVIPPDPRKRLK